MTDPDSEIKLVAYNRLMTDVNELFDLWWLNEELTARLFSHKGSDRSDPLCGSFLEFASWHQSWYDDAELYFASQYLLSYRGALSEIQAIVDEEEPRNFYEDQLKTMLWAFVSNETGKVWRATKQTEAADYRTKRWKSSAKALFSLHHLGKDEDIMTFFSLLHRIAIVNDVLNGRGKRHGLIYNKPKTEKTDVDPITAFCNQTKDIMRAFALKNGTEIVTNAKGVPGKYIFRVDADSFCLMMNELKTNYDYKLHEYLYKVSTADGAVAMTYVCPFIGHVLSLNIINTPYLQNTDLEEVLLQFYPGKKSLVTKLSTRKDTPEEEKLFNLVETLLKPYRKK